MTTEQQLTDMVNSLTEEYFAALRKLLRIPSVKGPAAARAPFGEGPREALDMAMTIAGELGFQTKMVNDAVGVAQLGESADYVGVIGHLDVVPAGDGWSYPPFDLTIEDGKAYGRGVLDNKGPALACLFALYAIKQLNLPLTKTVRILFGSDEESGSADIPLYLAAEPAPVYGFTPDCKYPAVYGERGMLRLCLETDICAGSGIAELTGNHHSSMVPDFSRLVFADGYEISAAGKRSPSNAPELGVNSIIQLAQALLADTSGRLPEDVRCYADWLVKSLANQHDGAGLGIDFEDRESGKLQLTPFDWSVTADNTLQLGLTIRYPVTVTEEQILSRLSANLPPHSRIRVVRSLPAVMFPQSHPMLKVMQDVYERCTGMDGTPVTTTGATYARSMPNIVAFGPSFPGQKGIAHNSDEYMLVADLLKNMQIYALTIYELAK